MPDEATRYSIGGNVGESAVVQQGEYLWNIVVQPKTAEDAIAVLRFVEEKRNLMQGASLPRRLESNVLLNRQEELDKIGHFFNDTNSSVLYVQGIGGIGKSALVRAALEFKRTEIPVVWVNCNGVDAERLLAEIEAGLNLGVGPLVRSIDTALEQKISAVLGAIKEKAILILDGFETLLNESGHLKDDEIPPVISALANDDHPLKTVVTTRRLQYGVGRGTSGVQILQLIGISDNEANELFLSLSGISLAEIEVELVKRALKRIEGHPLFIRMFASAAADIPVQYIAEQILDATDIGEYIMQQVLSRINAEELRVLRGALVFRNAFSFEALNATYCQLGGETTTLLNAVRSLVRRSILDVVSESSANTLKYHLHSLLQDAIPRESEEDAVAHAAAAAWFLRISFDPIVLSTWDDGLYHLRRSAQIGGENYFEPYWNFLDQNGFELHYAGWHRRLVSEYGVLDAIAPDDLERLTIRMNWAREMWMAGHESEALEIDRELDQTLSEIRTRMPEEDKTGIKGLIFIKYRIGGTLTRIGQLEEAQKLADEIEVLANEIGDLESRYRYSHLRWQIARNGEEQPQQVLYWASETLQAANQKLQETQTIDDEDSVAEAHFAMAMSYLRTQDFEKMFEHLWEQLYIKMKIRKLGGIGVGLYNIGAFQARLQLANAGAMLLTSEQIVIETGIAGVAENWEGIESSIQELLSDPQRIEEGRIYLGAIWDGLLPYYERGLSRRLG